MLDLFSYIDSGSALLPASSLVDFKLFDPKEKKHLRVHGRFAPSTLRVSTEVSLEKSVKGCQDHQ